MAVPTKAQFEAFGTIVHFYACAESGIKITLTGMLDIDLVELLILTEPASSFDLRNVAKSIAKQRCTKPKELERFIQIVGDLGAFGPLRNAIGHSRWTKGKRRGSIKPLGIDIRSGSVRLVGKEPDERDWTAKELKAEGQKLRAINQRLVQFMRDNGIIEAMARKDAANKF